MRGVRVTVACFTENENDRFAEEQTVNVERSRGRGSADELSYAGPIIGKKSPVAGWMMIAAK